jgi:hypothetical protein
MLLVLPYRFSQLPARLAYSARQLAWPLDVFSWFEIHESARLRQVVDQDLQGDRGLSGRKESIDYSRLGWRSSVSEGPIPAASPRDSELDQIFSIDICLSTWVFVGFQWSQRLSEGA